MKNVTSIDRKHAEDKFVVRMPQGLRDQLKQKAADNHRSANSEIVYRLERSNALEEELARANRMVDELFAKNQRLQAELAAVREREFTFPGAAQLRRIQSQLQALYGRYNDEAGRLQYLQTQGVCPTCLRRIDAAGFPEIQSAFANRLQKIQTDGVALRQQSEMLAMQETQAKQAFDAQ